MRRTLSLLALLLLPRTSPAEAPAAWGVYVYMGSDYTDVQGPSLDDLEEMEAVGSTRDLTVIVQRDGARGAGMRRYRIQRAPPGGGAGRRPHSLPLEVRPEMDSGSAASLEEFVHWALVHGPALRRTLVLAGHSWGWKGVIQDEQHRSIIRWRDAARAIRAGMARAGIGRLDAVVVDACITGSVEVAHALDGLCRYLVAPQVEMPYAGLPWDQVLGALEANPGMEPGDLVRRIVRQGIGSYAPGGAAQGGTFEPVALVGMDLDRMREVHRTIGDLAAVLAGAGRRPTSYPDLLELAAPDGNLDLAELAERVARRETGAVRAAARRVTDALATPCGPDDPAHRLVAVERPLPFALEVRIEIDPRRALTPGPIPRRIAHRHGGRGRTGVMAELLRQNPGLERSRLENARIAREADRTVLAFRIRSRPVVLGDAGAPGAATRVARHAVALRPAVGSSTGLWYRIVEAAGPQHPAARLDYPAVSVHEGSADRGPIVVEGHTHGVYPCRGPFVCFTPTIIPDHIVGGPNDYRALTFDAATRWSGFLFGP